MIDESNGMELLHFTKDNNSAALLGRIPCVVQLPFQEYLDHCLHDKSIYNIALAEFGEHWLDELLKSNDPDVIIGAGIEGMVHCHRIQNYISLGNGRMSNPVFSEFEDPHKRFDFLSCIPLAMVADTSLADGRKVPHAFADLLKEEYSHSMVYPDDGALLNSVMLLYIWKKAGYDGIRQFRQNAITGTHPSVMIKPGGLKEKPFIMIMPWIFARLKAMQPHMQLIWFEDGAPIIPLTVTSKDNERAHMLTDIIFSKDCARIFRKNGFFPSACTDFENDLPGKLQFIGWDILNREDVNAVIQNCRKIMENQK